MDCHSLQGLGRKPFVSTVLCKKNGIFIPDSVMLVCLLQACASLGSSALQMEKQLHAHVREQGYQGDMLVVSTLKSFFPARFVHEVRKSFVQPWLWLPCRVLVLCMKEGCNSFSDFTHQPICEAGSLQTHLRDTRPLGGRASTVPYPESSLKLLLLVTTQSYQEFLRHSKKRSPDSRKIALSHLSVILEVMQLLFVCLPTCQCNLLYK